MAAGVYAGFFVNSEEFKGNRHHDLSLGRSKNVASAKIGLRRVLHCSRLGRQIHPMRSQYGGSLRFVGRAFVPRAVGNVHDLNPVKNLSHSRDSLDTFDRNLPQVIRRHSALNHHYTSFDTERQFPVRAIASLMEVAFHPHKQGVFSFCGIRQAVRAH